MGRLLKLLAGSGGGSAPFTPASVAGLSLWLDFSDLATLFQDSARTTPVASDADPIGGVADKSGLANHASQGTASRRLTYKTAIKNSLSVGRFDGTDDYLRIVDANSLDCPNGVTIFAVILRNNVAGNQHVYTKASAGTWGGAFGRVMLRTLMTGPQWQCWTDSVARSLTGGTAPFATWQLACFRHDPAVGQNTLINGTSAASDANTGAITNSAFDAAIGARNPDDPGEYLSGDIGELLLYDSPVSPANRLLIETYLNAKWGVY